MPKFIRTSAIALMSAAALASLTACASTEEAPAPASSAAADAPATLTDGKLTACMTVGYKPLEYFENETDGEIIGFDADGIRALADVWGLEPVFENMAFDGLVPGLQASRCDILWSGLYMSEERLAVLDGTAYLTTGPAVAVVKERESEFTDELSLCGGSFATQAAGALTGVVNDTSDKCVAEGLEPIEVVEYPQPTEALASVMNGRLDGIVEVDMALAEMVAATEGLAYIGDIYVPDTKFGVFTQQGSEMSAAVAEGIATLQEAGTFVELAEKYGLDASRVELG
jgi:ABC-type amino acid transport/signal transduction systems, periplasmic component/domain